MELTSIDSSPKVVFQPWIAEEMAVVLYYEECKGREVRCGPSRHHNTITVQYTQCLETGYRAATWWRSVEPLQRTAGR